MTHGRGAWNVAGVGGTKKYKSDLPGPYYYINTGEKMADTRTADEYAVFRAVMAYQRAVNRRINAQLLIDGIFGDKTSEAVFTFQQAHPECGTPWGGIGPQTSEALLRPDVEKAVTNAHTFGINPLVTSTIVSGTIRHESLWDAGAVGYADPNDLGLAQINGVAHPDYSINERLTPLIAYDFVIDYYDAALGRFSNNVRDAVASYNLGAGGTRTWISQGRPDWFTPTGSTTPRNVKAYIDGILAG